MMGEFQNKLKKSAQEVLTRFVKKKSSLSQYPGKAIKTMAFFEVLFNELLYDPTYETKLIVDINKGRNAFRQAFGFSKTLSTEESTFRYWTLGALLDQGHVEKVSITEDTLQRKVLLRDLKNRIGNLRSQIEFDTSIIEIKSTIKKTEVISNETDTASKNNLYQGYCLRDNGTVYKTIYTNNCITNKEISYEEYLEIINTGSTSTSSSTSTAISNDGIEQKLKQIKSLFENDLITKDEYDMKRKEILDAF